MNDIIDGAHDCYNSDWDSRSVEFDTLTFVVIYVCILIVSFLGVLSHIYN